jgi:hypothetical protein
LLGLCKFAVLDAGAERYSSARLRGNAASFFKQTLEKLWLFNFGFQKCHGNPNFGFDLLTSFRFGFLKTETERLSGYRTSLNIMTLFY